MKLKAVIILFSGWTVFRDTSNFDRATFITSKLFTVPRPLLRRPDYLPAVFFPCLYFGYKIYAKTKLVDPYRMDCKFRAWTGKDC